MPDKAYAVQAKQQEWSQQEQSLKSIEQALNQFQVQENKLQRTVSELQALQHTTAQRVSSPLTPNIQPATHTHTFIHFHALAGLQHTTAQQASAFTLCLRHVTQCDTFMHCVRAAGFAAYNSTADELSYAPCLQHATHIDTIMHCIKAVHFAGGSLCTKLMTHNLS